MQKSLTKHTQRQMFVSGHEAKLQVRKLNPKVWFTCAIRYHPSSYICWVAFIPYSRLPLSVSLALATESVSVTHPVLEVVPTQIIHRIVREFGERANKRNSYVHFAQKLII